MLLRGKIQILKFGISGAQNTKSYKYLFKNLDVNKWNERTRIYPLIDILFIKFGLRMNKPYVSKGIMAHMKNQVNTIRKQLAMKSPKV